MPNFKVGDRVTYARKGEIDVYVPIGSEGEIRMIKEFGAEVEFKNCSQTVSFESLDLLSTFSVGQIYKVGKINDGRTGNIIKITNIEPNTRYPFVFKLIRGSQLADCRFSEGSVFANALTLLIGKQIGEAIKDFDEKKTGGVREVKRAAKPGEYIKIVKAAGATDDEYKNGDILLVIKPDNGVTPEFESGVAFYKNAMWKYASQCEYVVLEGYSPVKEVKRRAKVGDTIQITTGGCDGTAANNGAIGKVVSTAPGKVYAKFPPFVEAEYAPYLVLDGGYVVLEGYKPDSERQPTEEKRKARVGDTIKILPGAIDICHGYKPGDTVLIDGKNENPGADGFIWGCGAALDEYVIISPSGKHVWTPDEVERAKTIVLDTIREIYEESKGSVMFSRDAGSDKIFDAYLIEKGLSRLGYRPWDNALEARKVRKGTARCSDTDEPNGWIGKCVALCKVLHKPIPSFIMGD